MKNETDIQALAEACLPTGMQGELMGAMQNQIKARIVEALRDVARGGMVICNEAVRMREEAERGAVRLRHVNEELLRASLSGYLGRQEEWSARTFGHGLRTKGIVAHIRKELEEILASPHDLSEWVDVMILAMDGFWRHGGDPRTLMDHLQAKQNKNFARRWPAPLSEDVAVEHDRSGECNGGGR